MALDYNAQIAAIRKRQQEELGKLSSSPTGMSGSQQPGLGDLAAQQRLLKTENEIQKMKDDRLQNRWYGPEGEGEPRSSGETGLFMKTLDTLSKPLRMVVGGIDYATGKSPKKSLGEALEYNRNVAKRTFSDVLRDQGLPYGVTAPLGFVLDMTFDPVNWATLGTAALVPRVIGGGIQAGVRGGIGAGLKAAARGAESRVLESALTTRNIGRLIRGRIAPEAAEAAAKQLKENPTRFQKFMQSAEKRSLKSADEYHDLIGRTPLSRVSSGGNVVPKMGQKYLPKFGEEVSEYRATLGDLIREGASATPWVRDWFKYFDYNNAEWTRLARIKDILLRNSGASDAEMGDKVNDALKAWVKQEETGIPFEETMRQFREEAVAKASSQATISPAITPVKGDIDAAGNTVDWGAGKNASNISNSQLDIEMAKLDGIIPVAKEAADSVDIIKNPDRYITRDSMENALRMAEEGTRDTGKMITLEDLKDIVGRGELGETGFKFFDNLKRNITGLKYEIGYGKNKKAIGEMAEKVLDGFSFYISVFKRSKVGASLTAWTNAIVGNPTMAWMAGINIFDPLYMNRIKESAKFVIRGDSAKGYFLKELIGSREALAEIAAQPGLLAQTTGLSLKHLQARSLLDDIFRVGRDKGLLNERTSLEDLAKALNVELNTLSDAIDDIAGIRPNAAQTITEVAKKVRGGRLMKGSDVSKEAIRKGEDVARAGGTGVVAQEFFESPAANKWFESLKQRADAGSISAKLGDAVFNKMSEAYEGIDQTYKLGTWNYVTKDGVSEHELRVIQRMIKLRPEDLVKVAKDGVYRYQLSATKGFELANEIYLNYAAMPAAVKVFRNLPILGSPFASFMYGMTQKTAKTLAYNPAVFNKVGSLMNSIGGEQTPIEKAILEDPMYSYLKDPWMLKLPNNLGTSPFFQKHGMYLNVGNVIPFASLNMFTPSERRYAEVWPDRAVRTFDKLPFMKDPVGSAIFDYFIQPLILRDARPLGSFGQPLLPTDAGFAEKAGLFVRNTLVDPLVPGVASPIMGYAAGKTLGNIPFTETSWNEVLPMGYAGRRTAYATQGKTSIGKTGKEDPSSRTKRSILASMGIPLQAPVPMTFIPKNLKNQLKDLQEEEK